MRARARVMLFAFCAPYAALRVEPVLGRRQLGELVGGSVALLAPACASAEAGFKDLYTSDRSILSGGSGPVNGAVELPKFGDDGSLVGGGDSELETSFRTVRSGKASA